MLDIVKEVACAGLSAVLTVSIVHPFDVVKTRLQLSGKANTRNYSEYGVARSIAIIYKEEGLFSFWKGIKAAWLRESTYTSLRLGLYDPIKHAMGVNNQSSFLMKFTAGSLAGAIGSIVGNPFDVVKTRMMSIESKQSPSFYSTFSQIYQTNKWDFYKGLQANVLRACVLNGTKMACYDQIKTAITKRNLIQNEVAVQFCSALGAGFFMAVTVSPFDMIRTQLMTQNAYKNFLDCLVKILKEKGVRGLYAGFLPIWTRFAPTTTLQLLFFERLKKHINT
jgi:hypothetical protein